MVRENGRRREEGWWEVSGSEIDFMPESDSPEEGIICVGVFVCAEGRESPVWIQREHNGRRRETEIERERERPTCIKVSICMRKACCYFLVDVCSERRREKWVFVVYRFFQSHRLRNHAAFEFIFSHCVGSHYKDFKRD